MSSLGCNDTTFTHTVIEEVPTYIEPQVEVFNAGTSITRADFLVVLDVSGSMSQVNNHLSEGLTPFVDALLAIQDDLDWRLTAVSADSDYVEIDDWIEAHDVEFPSMAVADLQVMVERGGAEEGFLAGYSAYHLDTEFFRDNADLLFIFISDEDEQSSIPVSDWTGWQATLRSYPYEVHNSAITTFYENSCGYGVGQKYIDVSSATVEICSPTGWAEAANPVLDRVNPLEDVFYLDQEPDPDTIRVWVNNTEYSQPNWQYDINEWKVVLSFTPPSGSSVVISYYLVQGDTGAS